MEHYEEDEEVRRAEDVKIFNENVDKLNADHAVTMIGGDCVIMNEYYDPVMDKMDVNFSSFGHFRNRYMNRRIRNPWRTKGQSDTKDIGSLWLESKRRREYDRVVFDPDKRERVIARNGKRYYNMFRGFGVEPKKGDWSLLKDHIFEVVCGYESVFHWVMSWMARIVQDPGGTRPGTAIVLKGIQGCGKSCVINSMGKILGDHYLQITQQEQLTGRFNVHLKDAILVYCDEIIWGGDKRAEGILKGLVTEKNMMIEPKNKDAFTIHSHVNLMVSSNNDWVIPAGLEERRFCVLHVQPDFAGNRKYFNELHRQLENGGYEAMMHDLLHYDYQGVDLRTIPRTDELMNQILNSMHPVIKFWFERLRIGRILKHDTGWNERVISELLYDDYKEFAEEVSRAPKLSNTQFGRKLKEVVKLDRVRPDVDGTRKWCYQFGQLDECRKMFENVVKMNVDWDSL